MAQQKHAEALDLPGLRDQVHVFEDRTDAGGHLARMLRRELDPTAIILGVPAGGVPVAAEVAAELELELDVAVVSKITPPFQSEIGYGAIAWDGTTRLNQPLVRALPVDEEEVRQGRKETMEKVRRRVERLRGDKPMPELSDRTAVLVDDGIASGFTMRVAIEALRNEGACRVIVAVPTAPARSVRSLGDEADAIYVANLRHGQRFAVADAYRKWRDVGEDEAARTLQAH